MLTKMNLSFLSLPIHLGTLIKRDLQMIQLKQDNTLTQQVNQQHLTVPL